MQVKDESEWQSHLAELDKDTDPLAEVFKNFTIAWAENAEKLVELGSPAIEALRDTLRFTEDQQDAKMPVGMIGMMLVVLGTHWEPVGTPDDFFQSMTSIEQNLYGDVAAFKLMELQAQAQAAGSDGEVSVEEVLADLAKER